MGFDHGPYQEQQKEWFTHLFPYKLAQYRKKFLTNPTCIANIRLGGDHFLENGGVLETELQVVRRGSCHCVALWVDWLLWEHDNNGDDIVLSATGKNNESGNFEFPMHHTANLKFFEVSKNVDVSDTVKAFVAFNPILKADFDFNFCVNS